jgi:uncharacterized integral membrane protein
LPDLPRRHAHAAAASSATAGPARSFRRRNRIESLTLSDATQTEPAQPPVEQKRKRRRSFQPGLWTRLVPVGVVSIYLILFIAFNTRMTKVDFVFSSTRVSTIFLILLPLGIGIVLGVLLSQLYRHSKRRR